MENWCPKCGTKNKTEKFETVETLDIKGEKIEVPVEYYKCAECGNEFEIMHPGYEPISEAYRIYRDRKRMVQPEKIKTFRETYNLSQKELSSLLGWGGATLSRYENGALQDETHDRILQLIINNPFNLLDLIEKSPDTLTEEKRKVIAEKIRNSPAIIESFTEKVLFSYDADIYSGLIKFDMNKMLNMILIFCCEGIFKTKLNKLLFYADFKHFRENGFSITGARYAHLTFGPTPDKYEYLYGFLEKISAVNIRETVFPEGNTGEKIFSVRNQSPGILTVSENKTLNQINDFFGSYTSTAIMEFSHAEEGYLNTRNGELISYKFAEKLRV